MITWYTHQHTSWNIKSICHDMFGHISVIAVDGIIF